MTTAAEATALAPIVSAHATKATYTGSIPGHASIMAQAAAALTAIGGGANQATAYNSLTYTSFATACAQASSRAIGNGNAADAVALRTAQQVFTNLAAGV